MIELAVSDEPLLLRAEILARQGDILIAAANGDPTDEQRKEIIGLIAELQNLIESMVQTQEGLGQEILRQSRQSSAVLAYHRMTSL